MLHPRSLYHLTQYQDKGTIPNSLKKNRDGNPLNGTENYYRENFGTLAWAGRAWESFL
jgi:hypothetical protein